MANVNQYIPLVTAGEVISNSFTNANTDTALISNNTILLSGRIKFNGNRKYNPLRLFDMYILKSWYAKRMFIRHVQNKLSS